MASPVDSDVAAKPKAAHRIRDAAKDLFHRQGIRATGVEEVCRAADATKMSLYRAYPGKDALVAAILCEDAAAYDAWYADATATATTPAERLRALVGAVAAKLLVPEYRGCPLLLAQAEFRDPEHPTHRLVAEHKTRMRAQITGLAAAAGAREPEVLGDMLLMLVDGAWSVMPYMGGQRAASILREGADALLRQAGLDGAHPR